MEARSPPVGTCDAQPRMHSETTPAVTEVFGAGKPNDEAGAKAAESTVGWVSG